MKTITIIGRRWFNRVKGHSYFSVTVYVDGINIGRTPRASGYDGQYQQEAADILKATGYCPDIGANESLWRYCEKRGILLVDECNDVGRKKDL